MSYNGSGTFSINTAGQPVVAATTISSTVFNALTADLATGLSTAICKDGQTTTTASIPFVQGIAVTTGITTPSTTFALVNTTATTVNFAGGASTALNIGHASGTNTVLGATAFSQAVSPNGGITLGANYISRAGTSAGFSLDASNNATLSANATIGGTVTIGSTGTAGAVNLNRSSDGAAVVSLGLSGNNFNGNQGTTGSWIFNIDSTPRLMINTTGGTFAGTLTTLGGATLHTTSSALTDGAGVGAGTLLTAPAAGNPTKWIGINDNGTTRYIPAW